MNHYRSESARASAVFKYFLFSYVATFITFGSFAIVCGASGVLSAKIVIIIIALQNIAWVNCGVCMCMVFDSLGQSPPLLTVNEKQPPKEKIKERIIPVFTKR